jgi:hypothetical protein
MDMIPNSGDNYSFYESYRDCYTAADLYVDRTVEQLLGFHPKHERITVSSSPLYGEMEYNKDSHIGAIRRYSNGIDFITLAYRADYDQKNGYLSYDINFYNSSNKRITPTKHFYFPLNDLGKADVIFRNVHQASSRKVVYK